MPTRGEAGGQLPGERLEAAVGGGDPSGADDRDAHGVGSPVMLCGVSLHATVATEVRPAPNRQRDYLDLAPAAGDWRRPLEGWNAARFGVCRRGRVVGRVCRAGPRRRAGGLRRLPRRVAQDDPSPLPRPGTDKLARDSWIVMLERGADPRADAPGLAKKAGGNVGHVYRHAIHGFQFKGSAKAAAALRRTRMCSR